MLLCEWEDVTNSGTAIGVEFGEIEGRLEDDGEVGRDEVEDGTEWWWGIEEEKRGKIEEEDEEVTERQGIEEEEKVEEEEEESKAGEIIWHSTTLWFWPHAAIKQ